MLVLGLIGIGILLSWQISMATTASTELEAATGTDTTNLAAYLPFFIYFIGIVVMIGVFFWNRRDIQRWFPARK
jgi:hypothetical protein